MPSVTRKSVPKYEGIYGRLKQSILGGVHKAGDKLPPERKLSADFGVCHLTVRRALGKLVDEGMILRRSGSGTVVVYNGSQPPVSPRRLATVALVLEEVDDYTSRIVTCLENECRKRDLRLSLYCHGRDPNLQVQQYERAAEPPDSVVAFFSSGLSAGQFRNSGILRRTIIVDDHIPGLEVPQILSDDIEGMFAATKYLADLGHRTIGHICADTKITGVNRRKGYRKAVESLGLADDSGLVQNGSFMLESSSLACERILDTHPDVTALVCANDYAAYGAIRTLRKRGLVPGVNFSLTGYGNYDISEPLGLTSVDQRIVPLVDQVMFFIDEYGRSSTMTPGMCLAPTELKIRSSCVRV